MTGLKKILGACCLAALLAGCASTDQNGESGVKINKSAAEVLRGEAKDLEKSGKPRDAAGLYAKIFAADETDVESLVGLARNLRKMGKLERARAIMLGEGSKLQGRPEYQVEMAKMNLAEKKTAQAIEHANKALAIDSDHWPAHNVMGVALDVKGDYATAAGHYQKALTLSNNDPGVLNNYALSRAQAGDLKKGIALLQDAVNQGRATPEVRQNLALLYGIKGEYAQAKAVSQMDLDDRSVESNISYYKRFSDGKKGKPRKLQVN